MHADTNTDSDSDTSSTHANTVGVLRAMQVGTPHEYGQPGQSGAGDHAKEHVWTTSFFRVPVEGPRWLFTTHLEGNEQADRKNHGHPNQAVLLYAAAHYPVWQAELSRVDISSGGFGENFTVDGFTEGNVCLGDTFAIGEARIEVTGPRYPCWKIERRWNAPGLTARVAETGRTGWYSYVRNEGSVQAGMSVALLERSYPQWTVARMNDLVHGRETDAATIEALLACPILHPAWHSFLMRRLKPDIAPV